MQRVFSNGSAKDLVFNPFVRLAARTSRLYLAVPYFTARQQLLEVARQGKPVQLLVGLNSATSSDALAAVHQAPNVAVRYLTHRFHAKIYVFDDAALVGSSNFTDGGLFANRQATICLDQPEDLETVEQLRALFHELWDSGRVLTDDTLRSFAHVAKQIQTRGPDPDSLIEDAVGRAEPANINVASRTRTRERIFLEGLRRQVYEEYRPAFEEVTALLEQNGFRRPELADVGIANETNRFLNWVRLTHAPGDEGWQSTPIQAQEERRPEILRFGAEWKAAADSRVPKDYAAWLLRVRGVFGSAASITAASKEDLTQGLMCLHAFIEQLRFVKGGAANLPNAFWKANEDDVTKVKASLTHLIHGPSDFKARLHDVLYDSRFKLGYFGRFCALELFGSIKPDECPPMNGRMAKALRYLGFDVRGT